MYRPVGPGSCGEHVRLVIKHTFLEFQCHDEDDYPKLRRHNSDPLLSRVAPSPCATDTSKCVCFPEAPTPTTCASDDEESSLSSPCALDEDDGRGHASTWSFDFPQTPPQQAATTPCQVGPVWPESCDTFAVLSTCPLTAPANTTYHGCDGTEGPQSSNYDTQTDDALDVKTTLMIRNLPTDLSQPAFVQQFLEAGYRGLLDFVYMPMNLRAQGNFGYAFINFVSPSVAEHVVMQMPPLQHDEPSSSERWSSLWSTCQGLNANIERYRNSPLMHEFVPKECKPAMYDHSGNQVTFPKPTKKVPKPRIHWPTTKEGNSIAERGQSEACLRGAGCAGESGGAISNVPKHRQGRRNRQQSAK